MRGIKKIMTTILKSELKKTQILSELRTYTKKLEGGFSSDSLSDDLEISKQSIESARHRGIEGVIYHYNDVNYLAVFDILQSKIIKAYNSVDNENNKLEILDSLFNVVSGEKTVNSTGTSSPFNFSSNNSKEYNSLFIATEFSISNLPI